jgi:hypothetical protein
LQKDQERRHACIIVRVEERDRTIHALGGRDTYRIQAEGAVNQVEEPYENQEIAGHASSAKEEKAPSVLCKKNEIQEDIRTDRMGETVSSGTRSMVLPDSREDTPASSQGSIAANGGKEELGNLAPVPAESTDALPQSSVKSREEEHRERISIVPHPDTAVQAKSQSHLQVEEVDSPPSPVSLAAGSSAQTAHEQQRAQEGSSHSDMALERRGSNENESALSPKIDPRKITPSHATTSDLSLNVRTDTAMHGDRPPPKAYSSSFSSLNKRKASSSTSSCSTQAQKGPLLPPTTTTNKQAATVTNQGNTRQSSQQQHHQQHNYDQKNQEQDRSQRFSHASASSASATKPYFPTSRRVSTSSVLTPGAGAPTPAHYVHYEEMAKASWGVDPWTDRGHTHREDKGATEAQASSESTNKAYTWPVIKVSLKLW